MRISACLFALFCLMMGPGRAFDPGEAQDSEEARQKILKASDQIDLIESNYESSKNTLDTLKANVSQLQDSNTALKQQVTTLQDQLTALQASFDKAEAAHAKERQALLDEVAKLVASSSAAKSSSPGKTSKKKEAASAKTDTEPAAETATETKPAKTSTSNDSAPAAASTDSAPPAETPAATSKPQKGYYHIVESGETLTMICSAYRQQGIPVTVSQIEKANSLTEKSTLKVGQKLFIPKPSP